MGQNISSHEGQKRDIKTIRSDTVKVIIPLNLNYIIAFLFLLFLLMQVHQLLHHVVGEILCGKVGYLTFDKHQFATELSYSGIILATIPGPLVNYVAMWIGMFLLLRSERYNLLGFSLIFASMPLVRFLASFIGDEYKFGFWSGQIIGLSKGYSPIIGMIIIILVILPPLIVAYKALRSWRIFLGFLFLPVIAYTVFIFFPDHTLVVPLVEKTAKTGISLTSLVSLFWGLPIILIIAIVVVTILFFAKYVRYLLPQEGESK